MSTNRPSLQAKYELLLESNKSNSSTLKTLFAAALVVSAIAITTLTIYIAWNVLHSDINCSVLHTGDEKKSNFLDIIRHRHKVYGQIINLMNSSKEITTSKNVIPHTFVIPAKSETKIYKLVCYYMLPLKNDDLIPQDIDPTLCTHINIASLGVVNKSLSVITPNISEAIQGVVALKTKNPSLKVLICVAGYSQPGGFNDMVVTHELRKKFIKEVIGVIQNFSLDGVDLDWEFPAWHSGDDGDDEDKERIRFSQLLLELREALDKHHKGKLLSVAVGSPQPIIDQSYHIQTLVRTVDYINLMAYDYHFYVWYYPLTGANAPLYSRSDETGYFATLNTNWSSSYLVQKGVPKDKIVVGMPTYGHSFKLINADNNGWAAPASGFGSVGVGGFVTYTEVCWFQTQDDAKYIFDQECNVPYAYRNQEWISFDNINSLTYKTSYVMNSGFAGVMIFSLNQDDFKGVCDGNPFVLTQQVKNILFDEQL